MNQKDYAILFSKLSTTNDTYILMPTRIIEGEIDQKQIFNEKSGQKYVISSDTISTNMSSCYGLPISEEDLIRKYEGYIDMLDIKDMTSAYLKDSKNYMYIQKIVRETGCLLNYKIDVNELSIDPIDMSFAQIEENNNFDLCDIIVGKQHK